MYKIKKDKIECLCEAYPSLWEGITTEGKEICIKYRYGNLKLKVNKVYIVNIKIGEPLDGVIDLEEAVAHIECLEIIQ